MKLKQVFNKVRPFLGLIIMVLLFLICRKSICQRENILPKRGDEGSFALKIFVDSLTFYCVYDIIYVLWIIMQSR